MSWTTCRNGHTHWGRRGAAGLLVASGGTALLQLRAGWAHQGDTWSVPGGARERGESSVEAALRETGEELGLSDDAVAIRGSWVAGCGGWTYETVLAVPTRELTFTHNHESQAHAWVAAAEVDDLRLHSGFRSAWESADSGLRAFVESTA